MERIQAPRRTIERIPPPQPGQRQAIEQLNRDLVVSAGAGSGKTWVLTERYIEMLNHGTEPEQIVAITFTRKAANEMKTRIRQAIMNMEQTAESTSEKRYWQACREGLERAIITTIHGFCAHVLRDAPLESGIDPGFVVWDEKETTLMRHDVFRNVVDEWLVNEEERASELYQALGNRRTITECVLSLHAQLATYDVTSGHVIEETENMLQKLHGRFHQIRQQLIELVETATSLVLTLTENRKSPPKYVTDAIDWLGKMSQHLQATEQWDGKYHESIVQPFIELKHRMWRNHGPEELKELHTSLKETINEWLLCTEAPVYRSVIRSLLELTNQAERTYWQRKRAERALDFHDLERITLDVFRRCPDVTERWRNKIRYLMVDEFQDTNELQKTILEQLTGTDERIKRFFVGDGKQSIYQFRGADVSVFQRTGDELLQAGGTRISLDVNFRTQHRLIEYVNSLFRFLMNKEADDPDYVVQYEPLVAFRRPPHDNANVELLPVRMESGEDDAREREAEVIARRIRQMVDRQEALVWTANDGGTEQPRAAMYKDIAILLAARTHLSIYEEALTREGIPYVVVGGRGFYEKQEVLDLLNVLKFVQNEDDEVALLGFLRSPFVHLSDETLFWLTRDNSLSEAFFRCEERPEEVPSDEWQRLLDAREKYRHWQFVRKTETVYQLMRTIVEQTGFMSVLLAAPNGEQAALNVEKLMELARETDRRGKSLFEFLEQVARERDADLDETEAELIRGQGNAVVVMTVHASKGLEFPIVVIPNMDRTVISQPPRILYTPGQGLGVQLARLNGEPVGDGLYEELKQHARHRELQEAYRLFYVACTRARDYLVFSGVTKEQKNPKEELGTNWLDWTVKHLGFLQPSDLPNGVFAPENDWSVMINWESGEDENRVMTRTVETVENATEMPTDYPLLAPLTVNCAGEEQTFSVSAVMDYLECPRLYVLKHRWQMPIISPQSSDSVSDLSLHENLPGTVVGNVLHRVMETVETDGISDASIVRACQLEGVEPHLYDALITRIRPLVNHYVNSIWFERSKDARQVMNEVSFHYRLGSSIVHGVIDKIIVHDERHATIIDFKSNRINDEAQFNRLARYYSIQTQLYALVVQELEGLSVTEAIIYFLEKDRTHNAVMNTSDWQREKEKWIRIVDEMNRLRDATHLPDCLDEYCFCRQYLMAD